MEESSIFFGDIDETEKKNQSTPHKSGCVSRCCRQSHFSFPSSFSFPSFSFRKWLWVMVGIGSLCFVLLSGFLTYQLYTLNPPMGEEGLVMRGERHNRWRFTPEGGVHHPLPPSYEKCVNSKQGKRLIVDDKGRVCLRREVNKKTGCCPGEGDGGGGGGGKGEEKKHSPQSLSSSSPPYSNPCGSCRPFFSAQESTRVVRKNGFGVESFELVEREGGGRGEEPVFSCCSEFEMCVGCCITSGKHDGGVLEELGTTEFEVLSFFLFFFSSFLFLFPSLFPSPPPPFLTLPPPQQCMAMCRTNSCSVVHQKVYLLPNSKFCYGNVTQLPLVHYERHPNGKHQHCRALGS